MLSDSNSIYSYLITSENMQIFFIHTLFLQTWSIDFSASKQLIDYEETQRMFYFKPFGHPNLRICTWSSNIVCADGEYGLLKWILLMTKWICDKMYQSKTIPNKKVLLGERKRHTDRGIWSTPYAVLLWGGGVRYLGQGSRYLGGGVGTLIGGVGTLARGVGTLTVGGGIRYLGRGGRYLGWG